VRPVDRGASPGTPPLNQDSAKELLIERLGEYCSYCECRVTQLIELEHKIPQNLAKSGVVPWSEIDCWENYTLACKACNVRKLDADTRPLNSYLWPDTDNPLLALEYSPGRTPAAALDIPPDLRERINHTIRLLGLDRDSNSHPRATKKDKRYIFRDGAWLASAEILDVMEMYPGIESSPQGRKLFESMIKEKGFFSVYYTAFKDQPILRSIVLDAFPGTARSCFHHQTGEPIPRP
jgi:hypothetical protein